MDLTVDGRRQTQTLFCSVDPIRNGFVGISLTEQNVHAPNGGNELSSF